MSLLRVHPKNKSAPAKLNKGQTTLAIAPRASQTGPSPPLNKDKNPKK